MARLMKCNCPEFFLLDKLLLCYSRALTRFTLHLKINMWADSWPSHAAPRVLRGFNTQRGASSIAELSTSSDRFCQEKLLA